MSPKSVYVPPRMENTDVSFSGMSFVKLMPCPRCGNNHIDFVKELAPFRFPESEPVFKYKYVCGKCKYETGFYPAVMQAKSMWNQTRKAKDKKK